MSEKSLPITCVGRGCATLRCVRRRGYYCCADCRERNLCRRACQNDPAVCGLVRDRAPSIKEAKEYTQARRSHK